MRVKLVGCRFHKVSHKTIEDDVVRLIREPENKFDDKAIAVYNSHNEKIGYVASSNTISQGNRTNGCIDNIELGDLMKQEAKGIITKFRDSFGFIEIQSL